MGTDRWEAQTHNEKQQKLSMLDNEALEQIKIGKFSITCPCSFFRFHA